MMTKMRAELSDFISDVYHEKNYSMIDDSDRLHMIGEKLNKENKHEEQGILK